ncbi:MAG: hypothetical protein WBX15_20635 [Thermoanaerobaculia bacterium]
MKIRPGNLKRLLAGAIFGLYMAHLLYYLNPQIDITPARLVTVTLVYGVVCGLLFGGILIGFRILRVRLFGRNAEFKPHGFGFIVAAAFISALVYWGHLFLLRIYLPPGAVRILSKATTILGVTAFLLFLIWLFERNASRRTSNVLFALGCTLIAISAFFLYQRRDRYQPDEREVVVADISVSDVRPVIFVAIEDLPYDWILTMAGEGTVPFLSQDRGDVYFGRIEPFRTSSSKAIWASLITGKLPYRHGVTGRFSYETLLNGSDQRYLILPSGVGFRAWGLIPPVERISASLPSGDSLPLWQMYERLRLPSTVVNWPSTAASLPIRASRAVGTRLIDGQDPNEGSPPAVTAEARSLRVTPQSLDAATSSRFDGVGHVRKEKVLSLVAQDLTAARITRKLLEQRRDPVTILALEGLTEAAQTIGIAHNALPASSSAAGRAMRAYVNLIDGELAKIREENPDALFVVVSPSAFNPPPFPADPISFVRALLVTEDPGSFDGFIRLEGAGIRSEENPPSSQVVDVVPTTLFAAGLPIGRDMDGIVATAAFDDAFLRRSLSLIQTYEAKQLVIRRPAPELR